MHLRTYVESTALGYMLLFGPTMALMLVGYTVLGLLESPSGHVKA